MPNKVNKISNITLKAYVNFLDKCNIGDPISVSNLSDVEGKIANQLIISGYLSCDTKTIYQKIENSSRMDAQEVVTGNNLFLTPEGVNAFENWSRFIKEKSLWYIVGTNILRLIWLVVGALLASLPKIIELISGT